LSDELTDAHFEEPIKANLESNEIHETDKFDSLTRIADIAQLYQDAGRFDDAGTLRDYISRQPASSFPICVNAKKDEVKTRINESQSELKTSKWRIVQSLAIAGYILSLCLMLLPSWAPRNLLIQPVQPFLGAFGLWQAWNVFSPEIRKENYHLFAIIGFRDGDTCVWEFPRQENQSGIEQLRAHRFRKWAQDRVKNNTFGLVLPDTARYLARLHNNKINPPTTITISMLSANIPEPRKGRQEPLPPHAFRTNLFNYEVQAGDLK